VRNHLGDTSNVESNAGNSAGHGFHNRIGEIFYISDIERIIDVYNAVDTYVTPSLEENLPNTIMEAMTCGVPCVGFDIGGIPEMISHLENGYVAKYRNAQDFADGIVWVLEKQRRNTLGKLARQKAENEYCEEQIAGKYANIYHQLILNK
jgi:glycosyltransferase involved in cell wall biosynthesis